MRQWEQDLLQRELGLAAREADLRNRFASQHAAVLPTNISSAAPSSSLHPEPEGTQDSAADSTVPAVDAIDPDRSSDGGNNAGGGGEATLDMPAVIEAFEEERRALIAAFSG
jgi:hypothetical protein